MRSFPRFRVQPQRLYGAAVLGAFATILLAGLGAETARLFVFGVTPIVALMLAILAAGSLDGAPKLSLTLLVRQWLVFCVAVTGLSAVIVGAWGVDELAIVSRQVFVHGAVLYCLLGAALTAKAVASPYWLRVTLLFAAASTICWGMLAASEGDVRESGRSQVVAVVRPWLGFWPGVIEAQDREIEVSVPATR